MQRLWHGTDLERAEEAWVLEEDGRWWELGLGFEEIARLVLEEDVELEGGEEVDPGQYVWTVPAAPTKVVCIGLNYKHHAEEMGKTVPEEPLMFMKPTTALLPSGGVIEVPAASKLVHHEGELAVVIGAPARDIEAEDAWSVILGFTVANDVTARDIQRREQRYTRGKGFDTFCPLGPAMVLARGFVPEHHSVECRVNGEVRQQSGVDDLIFPVPEIVSFVSKVMTLLPGDVILTGTPAGVGELVPGDVVEVEIDGIGVLRNEVGRR